MKVSRWPKVTKHIWKKKCIFQVYFLIFFSQFKPLKYVLKYYDLYDLKGVKNWKCPWYSNYHSIHGSKIMKMISHMKFERTITFDPTLVKTFLAFLSLSFSFLPFHYFFGFFFLSLHVIVNANVTCN